MPQHETDARGSQGKSQGPDAHAREEEDAGGRDPRGLPRMRLPHEASRKTLPRRRLFPRLQQVPQVQGDTRGLAGIDGASAELTASRFAPVQRKAASRERESGNMSTVQMPSEQRFLLRCVDWSRYKAVANSLGERSVRLTYDGRNLEIMTVSRLHEWINKILGRLVETLTEELNIPLSSAGSTTFDREDVNHALEPDQCYYLANES